MDVKRELGRGVSRRKTASNLTFCVKKETDGKYRKIYSAVQKDEANRTEEERELLENNLDLVKKAVQSQKKREEVKARSEEVEDPDDILLSKCKELAAALRDSHQLVVYTGAGISTAAKIPDYRGSNGIWTLLQQGKDIGKHDLSRAEPTLTHMALFQLYSQGILKYVVSQNCDGLHLRSGLPRTALSEVHGNMHLEVCRECRPGIQYWRMFDVTENTGRFSHRTMRRCHVCHSALIDTIVHFGERGNLPWPLNWPSACKAADNADVILCIGSSLKVLKKYPWLWGMGKPVRKRPKLFIVNLQWTPKDDQAVLKINGRCDRVMQEVMKCLQLPVPVYNRLYDPIFCHATHLHSEEIHTTSQPELDSPFKQPEDALVGVREVVLKRANSIELEDCPMKLRKTETCVDVLSVKVKCEEASNGNAADNAADCSKSKSVFVNLNIMPAMKMEGNSLKDFDTLGSYGNNTCPAAFELKKEDPSGFFSKHLYDPVTNVFISEEVVHQVLAFDADLDGLHCGSRLTHSLASMLDKKEEKLSHLPEDETVTLLASSDPVICSKSSSQDISIAACIDGKENLAVHLVRTCNTDLLKAVKKNEIDKSLDLTSDSDNILPTNLVNKARTSGILNATSKLDPGKAPALESLKDSFLASKHFKTNGRSSTDSVEVDVGVLRMLQLEHNYSKTLVSLEEKLDEKGLEKEQNEKNDINEDLNINQSLRMSSRVREKQSAQQKECIKKNGSEKVDQNRPLCFVPKCNKPSNNKNKKLTKADFEMRSEITSRTCSFCVQYYTSTSCLFYPSWDPQPWQYEGCICECCDYSSDSEEEDDDGSSGDAGENKDDGADNAEEGPSKSSIINPGWYGKGYRKRFRRRR